MNVWDMTVRDWVMFADEADAIVAEIRKRNTRARNRRR